MKKTTDEGQTWVEQPLPSGGNIFITNMFSFSNINEDTIWGTGGVIQFGNSYRGMIYRTTNGGQTWGYQLPDMSIHSLQYANIQFIDKDRGWAYWRNGGVRTTTGGDSTIFSKC